MLILILNFEPWETSKDAKLNFIRDFEQNKKLQ